jgi:KTSC domain
MSAANLFSFTSPESSAIAGAEYDATTLTLTVTLRRRGGDITYQIDGFLPKEWVEFEQARSKGSHFNARIRPFYSAKPLVKR